MGFLRVVEVFPPYFRPADKGTGRSLTEKVGSFVHEVSRIRDCADIVLVANLKEPALLTVSTTAAASVLEKKVRVDAAPVIVARDSNRREIGSAILGAYSDGLRTLMLAWGDRGNKGEPKNVYDFGALSELIAEARRIAALTGVRGRLLAPVDLVRLGRRDGARLARSRLEAGADLLLAQPPTTDSAKSMDRHLRLLDASGLRDRVLLNIFPFHDSLDVQRCERLFGWKFSALFKRQLDSQDYSPVEESRALVRRMRKEGLPGVYLSTRGSPEIARKILG